MREPPRGDVTLVQDFMKKYKRSRTPSMWDDNLKEFLIVLLNLKIVGFWK